MARTDLKDVNLTLPKITLPTLRVNVVAVIMLLLPPLVAWLLVSALSNIYLSPTKDQRLVILWGSFVLGVLLSLSPQIAQQWERAVVLRLGRYAGLRGPGLFWIMAAVLTAWRSGSTSGPSRPASPPNRR